MEKVIEVTVNYFNEYFNNNNEVIEANLINKVLNKVGSGDKKKMLVENTIEMLVKANTKYYFVEESVNDSRDEGGNSYGKKYRRICKRK